MNQVNKLVNKIKDDEIQKDDEKSINNSELNDTLSHLTEDNLDEYLENVELDDYSKELIDKYLNKKYNKN